MGNIRDRSWELMHTKHVLYTWVGIPSLYYIYLWPMNGRVTQWEWAPQRLFPSTSKESCFQCPKCVFFPQAPHVIHLRGGVKMGEASLQDTIIVDGLTDAFYCYHMGVTGKPRENNIFKMIGWKRVPALFHRKRKSGQKARIISLGGKILSNVQLQCSLASCNCNESLDPHTVKAWKCLLKSRGGTVL